MSDPFESISLSDIPKVLPMLSSVEQQKILAELQQLERLQGRKLAQTKFIEFVK